MRFPGRMGRIFAVVTIILVAGCRSGAPESPAQAVPTETAESGADEIAGQPIVLAVSDAGESSDLVAARVTLAELGKGTPPEKLTPLASGPGIVVCEPVAGGVSADLADFAGGCGRWLHLSVGGHGELGQTPLWLALDRARRELGRPNLRLGPDEAFRMAGMTGASHVAAGTITGDAAKATLRYHLYAAGTRKPVGAPLTVSGTSEQIVAGLPGVARALAARLGVRTPRVPETVGLDADALRRIGRLPVFPDRVPAGAEVEALGKLAAKSPLAALAWVNTGGISGEKAFADALKSLAASGGNNPLVLGEIGRIDAAALVPIRNVLLRERQRFPRSYALAHTEVWLRRAGDRDLATERRDAETAVRAAPRSPDAWLSLAATLSRTANSVRRDRTADLIAPDEWRFLQILYPQWEQAARRATALDPRFGRAWLRLATAATFAGDRATAEDAFAKAARLEKGNTEVWFWGLQMFQPKWGGSPEDLARVAERAASESYPTPGDDLYVAAQLEGSGFPERARELRNKALARSRDLVRKNPRAAWAHAYLASALEATDDPNGAVEELRAVVRLRPDVSRAHYDLARVLEKQGSGEEALAEYRETLRLNPRHPRAHYDLGWALKEQNRLDEAEQELRAALGNAPEFPEARLALGDIYYLRQNADAAIREYEAAVRLAPHFPEAWKRLCYLYARKKQNDRAIHAGEMAVRNRPEDGEMYNALANACYVAGRYDQGVRAARAALDINPNDAVGYQNLGENLIGAGRKAEARAAWEKVLALDTGDVARAAQAMLDKHR